MDLAVVVGSQQKETQSSVNIITYASYFIKWQIEFTHSKHGRKGGAMGYSPPVLKGAPLGFTLTSLYQTTTKITCSIISIISIH